MRLEIQSQQGLQKLPVTQVHKLLDDQLLIFLRPWGSQDYNQKFIDEVFHYLSTAQADIEITSPFSNLENLTSLANKVRVSLLLAHDYFYRTENKSIYSVGFEVAILIKQGHEIAWGAVGRYDISIQGPQHFQTISSETTDRDQQVLLPVELLGVEHDLQLRCGSVSARNTEIIISSQFGSASPLEDYRHGQEINATGTYWLSKIKSE